MKFSSTKCKVLGYRVDTTFAEAQEAGEIISLADSQALRSIRAITKRTINAAHIDRLWDEKEELYRRTSRGHGKQDLLLERLAQVRHRITKTLFMPEYITLVIDEPSHYDHVAQHGLEVNGRMYHRFSCSAGQARMSTIVLVADDVAPELKRRINNGRDLSHPLAPSKFNAYFGLSTSATKLVSAPRFIVVKDYENTVSFMAHHLTETDWKLDDTLDTREITMSMNRTDGMGLISPELSQRWAKELGLDWTPSQWIVRQSFIKGMVCTFPFREFCEEINGGCYEVATIYTDSHGKPLKADLREVDLILSESQFKLWDSYENLPAYEEHCRENGMLWGVTQYSPREQKDMLTLNYQFIQTLDLDQHGVEALCEEFIDWVEGVSLNNRAYMLLFLLGVHHTQESLRRFYKSRDGWWMKVLAANENAIGDPFIRRKIRELIIGRIQAGCMGEIMVRGNFQTMVSDPYAYMEHVCGLPVKGLLAPGEYYANYWNQRGVSTVDAMRSPMTDRSEHVVLRLVQNDQTEKWYRYCISGVIYNWHGNECVRHAGADFDGDIVATTDNQVMIQGVYPDELPVVYDVPKPQKKVVTEKDLQQADKFGFGSIIGSITNKSTSDYALLPLLVRDYGRNSEEVKLAQSRVKQCCVAQSKGIDKTKIGRPVKGIPEVWVRRRKVQEDDPPDMVAWKELMNHTLLDRHPYFFKYRYPESKRKYCLYENQKQAVCKGLFGKTIKQLENMPRKTREQKEWLRSYYEYAPLIDSDSSMNLLCHHMESINFGIVNQLKGDTGFDWRIYYDPDAPFDLHYQDIVDCYERHLKDMRFAISQAMELDESSATTRREAEVSLLREKMRYVCADSRVVANALVYRLYGERPTARKELLWEAYGRCLAEAAMKSGGHPGLIHAPVPDENGEVVYLGRRYTIKEVAV